MPVVRELINRIGFKVNKGDLANVENSFGKIKGKGKGLIGFFGNLTKAIKGVSLALIGIASVGAVQFSKLEKNRALTRFFVTSTEQAKGLRLEMAKIRGESDVISKLEAEKAVSIFSRLNLKDITKNFKDIVPILTDISSATLKLDLPEVVSALVDFVKSGDIGQLEQFGGSVKDLAEKLSIAGFDASRLKTQEAKFKFIFEILSKNRNLFRKLAKDQEKTLTYAGKRVETQFNDFFANFGENTAEPIRQLLNEIAIVMKSINDNEDFWDAVKNGAIAVKDAFVETKSLIIQINKLGLLGFFKSKLDEGKTTKTPEIDPLISKPVLDFEDSLIKDIILGIKRSIKDSPSKKEIGEILTHKPLNLPLPDTPKPNLFGKKQPGQSININAEIILRGENIEGINLDNIKTEITRTIKEVISQPFKSLAAEYGGGISNV